MGPRDREFRRFVEDATQGIWAIDADTRTTYVNPRMARLLGYPPREMLGRPLAEFFHPEDRVRIPAKMEARRRGVEEQDEIRFLRKDGSAFWALVNVGPLRDGEGRFAGAVGIVTEFSERKLADVRLRAREAQLAEAQALARIGSWEWEIEGDRMVWSAEQYRLHGVDPERFVPSIRSYYALVHPDDLERIRGPVEHPTDRDGEVHVVEYRIRLPEGGVRHLQGRSRSVRDRSGRIVRRMGTCQDITERKTLERELLLAGRLAAVGTLASGVAHEINNPLTYVITHLKLVSEELLQVSGRLEELAARAEGDPAARLGEGWAAAGGRAAIEDLQRLREGLVTAWSGAERVRRIVKDLGVFGRIDDEEKTPVSLPKVLESTINLVWNEVRHRARLVEEFREVPEVAANEGRLGQVFLNLLINAAHAIPEGKADRHEIRVRTATADDGRALVEISDTGTGIPREIRDRIFDPFFTTRPAGAGMGLGLSLSMSIVRGLGGEISFESEVGRGTTFRVLLPRNPGSVVAEARGAERVLTPVVRGRVLVVDDEPLVAEAVVLVLSGEHEVVSVGRGEEALRKVVQGERFDVILCDLMMPEMSGMDLYRELHRRLPEEARKVVFLTGGAFTDEARAFLDGVSNPRVEKPFSLEGLREAVRRRIRP